MAAEWLISRQGSDNGNLLRRYILSQQDVESDEGNQEMFVLVDNQRLSPSERLQRTITLYQGSQKSGSSSDFFFFFVGKGGNASCTIAPERGCGGLHQGSPSWPKAFGRECPVSYPLKPPFAGVPAASLYVKLI